MAQMKSTMAERLESLGRTIHSFFCAYDQYVLACTVLLFWCFIFQEYFLFGKLFLFEQTAWDTLVQCYPIEYFRINNVKNFVFPFWSFQFGFGKNIYHEMINISPFDVIYLFFQGKSYTEAIPTVFFLQFLAASLIFQAFLKKIGLSPLVSFVGSILYSFSGYMVLNAHWYHYLNYPIFVALFLFFFEKWYRDGFWFPLVVLVGLVSLKNELHLYQMATFGFFYIVFRYINDFGLNRQIIRLYTLLMLLILFGLLLGAYFYLPDMYILLSSSRVHGAVQGDSLLSLFQKILHPIEFNAFLTVLLRTISPDLLNSWLLYRGSLNYLEASTFYVGLFPFVVFLSVFFVKNKKYKLLWIFPVVFWMVVFFPYFTRALNLFVSSTLKYISFYLGFFILFPFLLVMDSLREQEHLQRLNRFSIFLFLLVLLGILLASLWYPDFFNPINRKVFRLSFSFFTLYVVCLSIWNRGIHVVRYGLLVVVVIEAAIFARMTVSTAPGALYPFFHERGEKYFREDTRKAVDFIRERDPGFFRIEKDYRDVYLNDALVQNYFGTESYLGFINTGMKDFYDQFKLSTNSPNLNSYRYGLEKEASLQSLLLVKYFLCKDAQSCDGLHGFSLVHVVDGLRIYQNDHVHPFGQVFRRQIGPQFFQQLSLAEKLALVEHTVVSSAVLPGIPQYGHDGSGGHDEQAVPSERGANDTFTLTHWDQQHFAGSVDLDQPGVLFFPTPFDRGWRVQVNDQEAELLQLDFGFSGILLSSPGQYTVELRYIPPLLRTGFALTILCLPLALYLRWRYPTFAAY